MKRFNHLLLILLFLAIGWTNNAYSAINVTIPKTFGCDTLLWTGNWEQINGVLQNVNQQLIKSKADGDISSVAYLEALYGHTLEALGLYSLASELYQKSVDDFAKILTPDNDDMYAAAMTQIALAEIGEKLGNSTDFVREVSLSGLDKMPKWDKELSGTIDQDGLLAYNKLLYSLYVIEKSCGIMEQLASDFQDAIDHYLEAEKALHDVFDDSARTIEYANLFLRIGECYESVNDYREAITAYEKALSSLEATIGSNTIAYAEVLYKLAYIYYRLNDNDKAWAIVDQINDIVEGKGGGFKSHPVMADCFELMGFMRLNEINDISLDDAAQLFSLLDEASQSFDLTCKARELSFGENSLAYKNALLIRLIPDLLQLKDLDKCEQTVIDMLNEDQVLEASKGILFVLFWNKFLDDIHLTKNEPDKVIEDESFIISLIDAASKGQTTVSPETERDYYVNFGRAYIMKNDLQNAIANYAKVIDLYRDEIRNNFAFLEEEQRASFWAGQQTRFNSIVQLNKLGTNQANLGNLLYDAILLQKGLLLQASQNLSRVVWQSGNGDLQQKFTRLRLLKQSKGHSPEEVKALNDEVMSQAAKYGNFLDFVDVGWQDVAQSLGPHDVAIEFVTSVMPDGSTSYSAEVLRQGTSAVKHIHLFDVEYRSTELQCEPGKFNEFVSNNVWTTDLLRELRPGDHVWFSPAGELCSLGIEYLNLADGKRINEVYDMHRLTSTRELAMGHGSTIMSGQLFASGGVNCTLYGGLNYNSDFDDIKLLAMANVSERRGIETAASDKIKDIRWRYLPGTKTEVENISKILANTGANVTTLTGNDGIEETFKTLTDRNGILHIATHGFYSQAADDAMMGTGLVMSGANVISKQHDSTLDDGFLLASEIANTNINGMRLVVLSACNSGVGRVTGEGVFGLQRGFKQAGAQSILMSLWEIDDTATQFMMQTFYQALAEGLSPTASLHKAQESIRTKTFNRGGTTINGSDPTIWASFVILD